MLFPPFGTSFRRIIHVACAVVLLTFAAAVVPVSPVGPINAHAIEEQAFRDRPEDGIRDLFLSFQEDMIKFEKGELTSSDEVFDLLELPPDINKDREYSFLLKKAKHLFLVIQNLIFDYENDLPDADKNETDAVAILKTDAGNEVRLEMVNVGGRWRFSAKTLNDPDLEKLSELIRNRLEKFTRADMEGDTFVPDLMSPYRTMLNLRTGVMGNFGRTLQDAAASLDLSEIEPVLREDLGETLAVRLYRVLHFKSPLDMEQLSADPHTETIPVFLVEPGAGAVTMHVVTDKDGIKAWKFTPKSLDVIRKTYDQSMETFIDQGDDPFIGKDLPWGILADDLVQSRFPYLEKELFDIDLWKYLCFLVLIALTPLLTVLIRVVSRIIMNYLRAHSPDNMGRVTNSRIALPLTAIILGYLWAGALLFLVTSEDSAAVLLVILNIVVILADVWLFTTLIWVASQWISGRTRSRSGGTAVLVIGQVVRIIVIVVGLIRVAEIFGQDSTRVLAALGIGGVAIALAGKNTVENIFGTVMIVTTRPFAIGDFIIVNSIEGTVEHVGLRSTTIRTFYNSLVTVPNSHFITSPVDNMGKRQYRRFKTSLGIAYDTPPEKITAFVEGLRELAEENRLIDDSRLYIRTYDFGPSSIDILLDLHIHVDGRSDELEIRERFLLDAVYLASMLGVEFAFPTRTLYLRKEDTPVHEEMGGERRGRRLGREAASLIIRQRKEEEEAQSSPEEYSDERADKE